MEKLNDDTNNYLSMFQDKNFSETNFVGMLLPLLTRNGIRRIDERELRKKLYYFYQNPKFRELFQDICPARGTLDKEVDIYEGMHLEKYFSGSITWDMMQPEILFLHYNKDMDLSEYEQNLSEEGIALMYELARTLATHKKTEAHGKHRMHIYSCDPNKTYTIFRGKHRRNIISWQLLTDGDIKDISYLSSQELAHCFFDSPLFPNQKVQITDSRIASIHLSGASYAVMQGISDGKIQYSNVFTEIIDSSKLQQITKFADEINDSATSLTPDEPYVKKLILK